MSDWRFWIDRGGTFTDVVARNPEGKLKVHKLLSEDPSRYTDAAVHAIGAMMAEAGTPGVVRDLKMGTTVATNALLERRGEPTLLLVNRGYADALLIGYQNRPDLFALEIRRPPALYADVLETEGRIDAAGRELAPLDAGALLDGLKAARGRGLKSVAVCFMHAWRNPEHELLAGRLAEQAGFDQVSLSHEVSPLIKLVSRGDTTLVDAYLSPVLRRYISGLSAGLESKRIAPRNLAFMQSNGGLVEAGRFRGKDAILSGPAAGVVGAVRTARQAGHEKLICFDMGGTSTDVALYAGGYEYVTHNEIAGVRLRAPMLKVHTVAAGGGSVLRYQSGRFLAGPLSAGADPGPACYRNGGPLTVTDANLVLGRIQPRMFPRVFGEDGRQPLDREASREAFAKLTDEVFEDSGRRLSVEEAAEGFLRVTINQMASAIEKISVQRGENPAEFALCSFGGAGGQHACAIAEELGMDTVLLHPLAGVLSALGLGLAPLRAYRQEALEAALDAEAVELMKAAFARLGDECRRELLEADIDPGNLSFEYVAEIRVRDSDNTLPIPVEAATHPPARNNEREGVPSSPGREGVPPSGKAGTPSLPEIKVADLQRRFSEAHRARFGIEPPGAALVVEAIRVQASGDTGEEYRWDDGGDPDSSQEPRPAFTAKTVFGGARHDTPAYRRRDLGPGHPVAGPAIISEDHATTVVPPGWQASARRGGHLVLARLARKHRVEAAGDVPDPVLLEVFNNRFMHIAEQMGAVLENTAHSVNIKERLDFSCALFDSNAELVANAPHMPVHLGSMDASVKAVLTARKSGPRPGEAYLVNAPYNGGTHLPDLTVVSPVFLKNAETADFFVASRAHHADIGGITPGSMPPDSRHIDEEGVLFDNFLLVSGGRLEEARLNAALTGGPWPARNPARNLADIKAQLAANAKGARELKALVAHYGASTVRAYMTHVRDNAEESVRRVIDQLEDGRFECTMDGGERIVVDIRIDRRRREAVIDFSGSSGQSAGNFNAPSPICRACVLYVFRSLVGADIPMNSGCMKPLRIILPEGTLLNPRWPAAVVAGNVETSQCVVDTLYGALEVMAAAQGTMNNVTFGNERYQYYETVCGGSGAGPGFDGASAVHTHMTNSRLTDPEVLELRFPVLLREFRLRRGSGGSGWRSGGDGAVRRIEFREPMELAILSNRRRTAPFGLAGGGDGAPGRARVLRSGGGVTELTARDRTRVEPGDLFVIETPGGGGYGAPENTPDV